MIRQGINYGWKYCERWDDKYIAPDAVEDDFIEVDIPHANKEIPYNNFDEEMYQFISCYRKRIKIDSSHKGKRIILEFGAVANMADVYFNGEHVGEHKGGYTAFTIDVTDNVLWGKDNLIVVKVDSTERPDIPPFGGVVDYLCYGGIYREVYLQIRPSDYIKRMLLTPEVPARGAPKLTADITLSGSCEGVLNIEVCDAEGVVVASAKREGEFIASEGKLPKVTAVFKIPAAKLWDIDNPYLYTVIATFGEDEVRDRCGLRHCAFAKDGFYLNHKPIKIVGLNRHQSYPYVGYAMPAHVQKDEAEFLKKELGVNLVRTSHYPNSRHFLDRCDELGLLVFTEIPGWQYVSKDETWREVCLQHVREMIREDYNHPSIILWGVRINESGDDDALYTATNALAHKLDKSRPTGGVRCIPHSHLLEDVYTYNDFIHSGGKTVLLPKFIVCSPSAPLLVTEHNGHMFPTKTFDHEKKRQEHAIRHARVIDKAFASKGHAGVIGWCMSDYNTHKDFGSGDKICYHGVTDMFRMDKLAAYVYKSQQKDKPVLEISSNMEIGDNAGGQVGDVYMFTNCDEVRMYKSGELINIFDMNALRKKSEFKHMPMPPVLLYDVIGNQLEKDEHNFSKRDAEHMKRALLSVKKHGTVGGIIRHPLTLVKSLIKYKLSVDSITMMFGKYVTGWGGKQVSYSFEGYIGGEKVITVGKGAVYSKSLDVKADRDTLYVGDTYDAVRIGVKMCSQMGNTLIYDNSVVSVSVEGDIEVIGPKQFALIGGQRAFWIKSTAGKGSAKVTVCCEGQQDAVLQFNIAEDILPKLERKYIEPQEQTAETQDSAVISDAAEIAENKNADADVKEVKE